MFWPIVSPAGSRSATTSRISFCFSLRKYRWAIFRLTVGPLWPRRIVNGMLCCAATEPRIVLTVSFSATISIWLG